MASLICEMGVMLSISENSLSICNVVMGLRGHPDSNVRHHPPGRDREAWRFQEPSGYVAHGAKEMAAFASPGLTSDELMQGFSILSVVD